MGRKQLTIKGTERADIPPEMEETAASWLELKREKRRLTDKVNERMHSLIAMMQSHKIPRFRYTDPDTGEVLELAIDLEPKLSAKKSGEIESEIGDAVESGPTESSEPGIHPGLIAQAERAQAEAGVSENEDGDVVPKDEAAPTSKRKRRKPKLEAVRGEPEASGEPESAEA